MSWLSLPTRTSSDLNAAADINALMANILLLGGNGTSQPSTDIETLATQVVNAGDIIAKVVASTPTGFLLCDGSAISRTTYSDLYSVITASKGTFTVSIASPGVVTLNTHGLATGDCVELTTDGALPTGLAVNTNYYVVYNDANSFWLATSYANAVAGTKINTSGSQSGTHTLRYCPFGISTAANFLLPDLRGVSLEGAGQQGTAAWASANYLGGLGHYKQDQGQGWQLGGITGGNTYYATIAGGVYNPENASAGSAGYRSSTVSIGSADGLKAMNNNTHGTPRTGYITAGPRVGVKYYIKY